MAQHRASNPVLQWNAIASRLMVDPGPIIDTRAYAILHTAIHDAVNGVERRYQPYTAALSYPGASLDAAVATAARDVIVALSASTRAAVDEHYARALDAIPDGPAKRQGIELGRRAAEANLSRRAGDGVPAGRWPPTSGPIIQPIYAPTGKPGDYSFTPPFDSAPMGPIALFPGWGRVTPFAVDLTRHRLPGPDPLASEAYARDVDHVRVVGSLNSSTRTDDQGQTAFFWFEDFPIWNQIANTVLAQNDADPWEAARTLAQMHIAMTDALIACFDAKYRYRFWRPFTAIRQAADDGNRHTSADTAWLPLLWTASDGPLKFFIPPIPDYPSAAATGSAAAAEVLARALGNEQRFAATSPFLPGVTRQYSSFSQASEEAGLSRVYGGIHFLRAVRDGFRLGKGVGRDASRLLQPVHRERASER